MSELEKLKRLKCVFDELFLTTYNTCLIYGAEEPFYKAPMQNACAQVISREDYLSSALHEIAHWTIAGPQRRGIDDFGYWYQPDGRSETQQRLFEQVEVKPQAVEWALAVACRHPFHLSADNLDNHAKPSERFKRAVSEQFLDYWHNGLPARAEKLFDKLVHVYHQGCRPKLTEQVMELC